MGQVHCVLFVGKSRVTPLKLISSEQVHFISNTKIYNVKAYIFELQDKPASLTGCPMILEQKSSF